MIQQWYFYVNGSASLKVDAIGAITMPNQPAFHVNKGGTDVSNIAGKWHIHCINLEY